jgi:hypothetical protein
MINSRERREQPSIEGLLPKTPLSVTFCKFADGRPLAAIRLNMVRPICRTGWNSASDRVARGREFQRMRAKAKRVSDLKRKNRRPGNPAHAQGNTGGGADRTSSPRREELKGQGAARGRNFDVGGQSIFPAPLNHRIFGTLSGVGFARRRGRRPRL